MSEEENKGFTVRDRRIHSEGTEEEAPEANEATDEAAEGAAAEAAEEAPAEEAPAEEAAADTPDEEEPQADAAAEDAGAGIPITFATFVISLGDSAMIHLGAIPHPATGERATDLLAARQTIDILGILEDKTKGNLSEEEQQLMSQLLYALRMQFVQAGQGG